MYEPESTPSSTPMLDIDSAFTFFSKPARAVSGCQALLVLLLVTGNGNKFWKCEIRNWHWGFLFVPIEDSFVGNAFFLRKFRLLFLVWLLFSRTVNSYPSRGHYRQWGSRRCDAVPGKNLRLLHFLSTNAWQTESQSWNLFILPQIDALPNAFRFFLHSKVVHSVGVLCLGCTRGLRIFGFVVSLQWGSAIFGLAVSSIACL